MNELVRYDAMCRAIDAAHAVDEIKDIRDKAKALEACARIAQNTDAERRAAEIRMRAERKAGQLLAATPKAKGAREPGTQRGTTPRHEGRASTLKELGISEKQSSQWQKLGAMPQEDFDIAIGASVKPPSTNGVINSVAPKKKFEVSADALELWGKLMSFDRDGLLDKQPMSLVATMTEPMKDDVHRLAPKVGNWLKRIGVTQ